MEGVIMLNIYKTQYVVKDVDMGNKTHYDIISVFACNIAEALEKTKAKINTYKKEYPMYVFEIAYGPKKRKEFNPWKE